MIILFNPRATKPRNRRFPLSILALAAVLEGREEYAIVDGNLDPDPVKTIVGIDRSTRYSSASPFSAPGRLMLEIASVIGSEDLS